MSSEPSLESLQIV